MDTIPLVLILQLAMMIRFPFHLPSPHPPWVQSMHDYASLPPPLEFTPSLPFFFFSFLFQSPPSSSSIVVSNSRLPISLFIIRILDEICICICIRILNSMDFIFSRNSHSSIFIFIFIFILVYFFLFRFGEGLRPMRFCNPFTESINQKKSPEVIILTRNLSTPSPTKRCVGSGS